MISEKMIIFTEHHYWDINGFIAGIRIQNLDRIEFM